MTSQIPVLEQQIKEYESTVALAKANCATTFACLELAKHNKDAKLEQLYDKRFDAHAYHLSILRSILRSMKEDLTILKMAEHYQVN